MPVQVNGGVEKPDVAGTRKGEKDATGFNGLLPWGSFEPGEGWFEGDLTPSPVFSGLTSTNLFPARTQNRWLTDVPAVEGGSYDFGRFHYFSAKLYLQLLTHKYMEFGIKLSISRVFGASYLQEEEAVNGDPHNSYPQRPAIFVFGLGKPITPREQWYDVYWHRKASGAPDESLRYGNAAEFIEFTLSDVGSPNQGFGRIYMDDFRGHINAGISYPIPLQGILPRKAV